MCAILDNTDKGTRGGTSRVELSGRPKGQPTATRCWIALAGRGNRGEHEPLYTQRNYNPPSKTALTSSTVLRSVKNGQRSVSSVSWGSLNQEETGTALLGWKI